MENRFHRNIDIPVEFNPFIVKNTDDSITDRMIEKSINLLDLKNSNPQFIDWLDSLNLKVSKGRYFESLPEAVYDLHVDDYRPAVKNIVKLNFIFSSHGSEMIWYELLPGFEAVPCINALGEYMPKYPEHHVKEVYRHPADTHCLIDGRHIHTLKNSKNQDTNRICYSLFLMHSTATDKKLDWDSAIDILSPYIKN